MQLARVYVPVEEEKKKEKRKKKKKKKKEKKRGGGGGERNTYVGVNMYAGNMNSI